MPIPKQRDEDPSRPASQVENGPAALVDERPVEAHVFSSSAVLPVIEVAVLEGLAAARVDLVFVDVCLYMPDQERANLPRAMSEVVDAVVLLSGGLDSATVLALARAEGRRCHALSFRYGQRHAVELEAASRIAAALGVASHHTISIDLRAIGGSALTADIAVPKGRSEADMGQGIPVTYVPARNTLFVAYALAVAEVTGSREIFLGINALDYSGYPDCRPEWLNAMQEVARLGTRAGTEGKGVLLRAPLVTMSKADIVKRGLELGVDFSLTHSCYDPADDGGACAVCDSCLLRRRGFEGAGVPDPTRYAVSP